MITLAPELENSTEVVENLTKNGVTVSVGNLLLFFLIKAISYEDI